MPPNKKHPKNQTKKKAGSVRVKPETLEILRDLGAQTEYSAAQVVEMCVADVLESCTTGQPITPRLAKIVRALKAK